MKGITSNAHAFLLKSHANRTRYVLNDCVSPARCSGTPYAACDWNWLSHTKLCTPKLCTKQAQVVTCLATKALLQHQQPGDCNDGRHTCLNPTRTADLKTLTDSINPCSPSRSPCHPCGDVLPGMRTRTGCSRQLRTTATPAATQRSSPPLRARQDVQSSPSRRHRMLNPTPQDTGKRLCLHASVIEPLRTHSGTQESVLEYLHPHALCPWHNLPTMSDRQQTAACPTNSFKPACETLKTLT